MSRGASSAMRRCRWSMPSRRSSPGPACRCIPRIATCPAARCLTWCAGWDRADPQETRDLATDPGYRGLLARCDLELRRVVDPDAADALAKADQRAKIAAY